MNSFSASKAEYHEVSCNVCGQRGGTVLTEWDARGRPARTVLCRTCGFIYLSPRMTKEWYRRYYATEYRRDVAKERDGRDKSPDILFARASRLGYALADFTSSFVGNGLTIDVGSATGGVLAGWKERLPSSDVVGIEPSYEEARFARSKGIPTHCALLEDFHESLPPAATILSTRTLNHFLEPRFFLDWAWHHLCPHGHLVLTVLNFRQAAKKAGSLLSAVQIDHPSMFVPETLAAFVEHGGFEVLLVDDNEEKTFAEQQRLKARGLTFSHTRLIARKIDQHPFIQSSYPVLLGERVLASLHPTALKIYHYQWRAYNKMKSLFSYFRIF